MLIGRRTKSNNIEMENFISLQIILAFKRIVSTNERLNQTQCMIFVSLSTCERQPSKIRAGCNFVPINDI